MESCAAGFCESSPNDYTAKTACTVCGKPDAKGVTPSGARVCGDCSLDAILASYRAPAAALAA